MQIDELYMEIMESNVFMLHGNKIELCEVLIQLCAAIDAEEDTDWSLGEDLECSLANLLIGAYWALTLWHAGQESMSYAAMCTIGMLYSPGMSSGPEDGSSEVIAYEAVCRYFKGENDEN